LPDFLDVVVSVAFSHHRHVDLGTGFRQRSQKQHDTQVGIGRHQAARVLNSLPDDLADTSLSRELQGRPDGDAAE